MQDNKPNNQSLDDDILQSKADLREVFKMMGRPGSDDAIVPLRKKLSGGVLKSVEADDIFLEVELLEKSNPDDSITDDLLLPDTDERTAFTESTRAEAQQQSPLPIKLEADTTAKEKDTHIDQLRQQLESITAQRSQLEAEGRELMEKLQQMSRESDSLKFQLAQEKNTRENLQKDLKDVKKELQEKTLGLNQHRERLEFLEKQLQNAVVLERAKSRFQQEAQTLSGQNQQLAAEVVKLRKQMDGLHKTDQHVQTLREELQASDRALSVKEGALRQTQETMNSLKEKLSRHQQREAELSGKLAQNEEALSTLTGELNQAKEQYRQLQGDAEQLRHEYEAFQTQANGEIGLLQEKNEFLKQENNSLSTEAGQLKEAHQRLEHTAEELITVEVNLQRTTDELGQERRQSEKLRSEHEALAAALSQTQQEKETLLNRVHGLESSESGLREDIETLRQAVVAGEALREELTGAQHAITQLQEEKQQLQCVAEELETVKRNLTNTDDEFQQEREFSRKLRIEHEELTSEILKVRQEKEGLLSRIQILESVENDLRNEIRQFHQSADADASLRDELERAKYEINRLHEENRSLEAQLDDIQEADFAEPEEDILESAAPAAAFGETTLAEDDSVPVFNLAEQIMEEQRRSIASRRQRVAPTASVSQGASIENVIRQYIPSSGTDAARDQSKPSSTYLWTDQSLTPFQQEILREIVRKDMEFYSHKHFLLAAYPSMNN